MNMKFESLDQLQIEKLIDATLETIYITIIVSLFVLIVGLIVGILLYALSEPKLYYNKTLYTILSSIINVLRSIPFIILLFILIPVTSLIMGTITGANAALIPLVLCVAPFYARLVETACKEVDATIIELGYSLGLSKIDILKTLIYKEAKPAIFDTFVTTIISIISFTTMAGVIGAGGLGNMAYIDGFQRNNGTIMYGCTIIILVIVFITQFLGKLIVKKIDKRRII